MNFQECKISVIVPVYKVRDYIDRCIKSLVVQSLRDIEVICVCDKEDSSFDRLVQYSVIDNRIKVIERANQGVSSARNRGLDVAIGEYIAFVDADDWIERYTLKCLYHVAEKYCADIVCFGMYPTQEPSLEQRCMFGYFTKRNVIFRNAGCMKALFYEHGSRPYIGNKIYSRRFLKNNRLKFSEFLSIGEDQLFQFEAFYKAKCVCYLREKFYHYEIGRRDSAMSLCSQTRSIEHQNILLLSEIIRHKNSVVKEDFDMDYLWFVLQDYGIAEIANPISERRALILSFLETIEVAGLIEQLPRMYAIVLNLLYETYDVDSKDIRDLLPSKQVDEYRRRIIERYANRIWEPHFIRRMHEAITFSEIRHIYTRMKNWIVRDEI